MPRLLIVLSVPKQNRLEAALVNHVVTANAMYLFRYNTPEQKQQAGVPSLWSSGYHEPLEYEGISSVIRKRATIAFETNGVRLIC